MNKEHLTYIIIGIVAVIIIIFLINLNQPKQEITAFPVLTLPPLNSDTINSINIYDPSNNSILKPISTITTQSPTTTILPPITRTITQSPIITTIQSPIITTIQPPPTTTRAPITTTPPPITTTLPPITTTPPPITTTRAPITTTPPPITTTPPPITTTPPPTTTQEPFLYTFKTFTFTSAEKLNLQPFGNSYYYYLNYAGPSLALIRNKYSRFNGDPVWIWNDNFFNMKLNGIQLWTVPVSGYYDIRAVGASGGGANNYGKGRDIQVNTFLKKGEIIQILVGQAGKKTQPYNSCSSGGGGTFVVRDKETPIIIAGGGGGSGCFDESLNSDASAGKYGNNGAGNIDYGIGGENGNGGTSKSLKYLNKDTWWKNGSGGGGLLGNGKAETEERNTGRAFINGGGGGRGGGCNSNLGCEGGFGGGGAFSEYSEDWNISGYRGGGGGGGGGYSGGGEGGMEVILNYGTQGKGGGGGGSYVISEFTDNGATNIGDGSVTITLIRVTPTATITTTNASVLQNINNLLSTNNNIFEKKQRELEEKIKQQKEKEKEELFNIPLIPVFNSNDIIALIPTEGYYNIYTYGGNAYPLMNPTTTKQGTGPNDGSLGNLFDNNNTTGVLFETWHDKTWQPKWTDGHQDMSKFIPGEPHIIVITMPVSKTFKGKVRINTYTPYQFERPITKISINTAQSLDMDKLKNSNRYLDGFGRSYIRNRGYKNEYVESSVLDITSTDQSFDLNFTIKFNTIIIEILERSSQVSCYISNISFEKSR